MQTKIKNPLIVLLISICVTSPLSWAQAPDWEPPQYLAESWRGVNGAYGGNFVQETNLDTGLYASIDLDPNEPYPGYPYHSGIVEGLSDTIVLIVSIDNRNVTAYDISSYQPDNWFYPEIYDINVDPTKSHPLQEPSRFGYSFKHWYTHHYGIVSQPTEIPPMLGGFNRYELCYYIWGIPAGRYWVTMKKTENAPDGFKLLANTMPATWITKPTMLADTLNAFIAMYIRAEMYGNYTICRNLVDSVLTYNPTSIPGWELSTRTYCSLKDSLNMIVTFDSTLAILNRYGDPALPDSAKMDRFQRTWYQDFINLTTYFRWGHLYGGLGPRF